MGTGNYDVLMIDPPWPKGKGGKRSTRPNQERTLDYATMPVEECFELLDERVFNLTCYQHTVFMRCIDAFLCKAEEEMVARGYRRHARLIWDKQNGIAPAFSVRYAHEYLIWFYKPLFTPVAREARGKYSTVFTEKARQHSRKPDSAYTLVELLYPEANRLDVFSREKRLGWDQWGNEVDYFARGNHGNR